MKTPMLKIQGIPKVGKDLCERFLYENLSGSFIMRRTTRKVVESYRKDFYILGEFLDYTGRLERLL